MLLFSTFSPKVFGEKSVKQNARAAWKFLLFLPKDELFFHYFRANKKESGDLGEKVRGK
jgi:hypothetical protein